MLKLQVGAEVAIGNGELVATLAATKNLARTINKILQTALPRDQWADLLVQDLAATEPGHLASPRKCTSYARHLYEPLKLSEAEIVDALTRAGY